MFVVRSEEIVSPGATREHETYQMQSLEVSRRQPGFIRELRAVYMGNFAHRLVYQMWDNKEAYLHILEECLWNGAGLTPHLPGHCSDPELGEPARQPASDCAPGT